MKPLTPHALHPAWVFTTDATNRFTPDCGLFNGSVLPIPAKVLVYSLSQEIHNPREEDQLLASESLPVPSH